MAGSETFDVHDDRFDDDDWEHPRQRRPVKSGWSTTTKVLLGILGFGFLCLFLCCGGIVWQGVRFAKNLENAFTEEPEKIVEIQESITAIDLPAELTPQAGANFDLFGVIQMKMAIYGEDESGSLILMETKVAGLSEEELEKQFKKEAADRAGQSEQITTESSETKTFTINGKECRFEFVKGTRQKSSDTSPTNEEQGAGELARESAIDHPAPGAAAQPATDGDSSPEPNPAEAPAETTETVEPPEAGTAQEDHAEHVRQVSGLFPSRGGVGFLLFIIPEEKWDEAAAIKMIESIHQ